MKNIIFCIALLLHTASSYGQSNLKMAEKADEYRLKGNYRVARAIYEDVLKFEPEQLKANYGLGICLLNTSDKSKAHLYLIKARQINSKLEEIDFLVAISLQYAHKYQEASAAFEGLLKTVSEKKDTERHAYYKRKIQECKNGLELMAYPVSAIITNLGSSVNTKYKEYSPALTRDESKLVFTSRRPGSVGNLQDETGEYLEDIYISNSGTTGWSEPRNLGKLANTEGHDASISFSPDGNMLFIYRDENGGDIYVSDYNNQEWSAAKPFHKKVNSKYNESSISMSADGKMLFFSSDRPGGQGGKDLYMMRMDAQGKWLDPANLGPVINTPYDDDAPFIHSDGHTLYFSSKGHKTMGGYDIFKSDWNGTHWTEPENLGYPINSADDDIFFMISNDNKRGYYASYRDGGFGESDLYMISMPQKEPLKVFEFTLPSRFKIALSDLPQQEPTPPGLASPFTLFSGKVYDDESKQPIEATVVVMDNQKGVMVARKKTLIDGSVYLPLLSGVNYGIQIEHDGYMFYSDNIDLPRSFEYQLYLKDIWLQRIKVGTKTILRNVFFETNSATIKPESEPELNKLFDLMMENPKIKVELSGHTDDVGTDQHNKNLSLDRAKSVVSYLTKKGIAPDRLKYKGYGKDRPVANNTDETGRRLNRRTEFEIIGN